MLTRLGVYFRLQPFCCRSHLFNANIYFHLVLSLSLRHFIRMFITIYSFSDFSKSSKFSNFRLKLKLEQFYYDTKITTCYRTFSSTENWNLIEFKDEIIWIMRGLMKINGLSWINPLHVQNIRMNPNQIDFDCNKFWKVV